ncbi:MAG: 6-phosphogluconolactonase [Bdellovibrionales bacterium]|nr:6-phosphogluconolactonase [Bdellovibrionales bacterium]
MQTLVGKDDSDWVRLAWTWIHSEVENGQRVFVPAGGTPTPLYRRLCEEPTSLWRSLKLIQIDEILNGPKRGIFRGFFEAELKPFLAQMEWIGDADRAADVAILGVGINGHVAFHEPQLPRHFGSGCVRLSQETLSYLDLKDPTWGVTYGVAAFARAKKILVLAQGEAKQRVLRQALIKRDLPVSWILEHPNVTLISNFAL